MLVKQNGIGRSTLRGGRQLFEQVRRFWPDRTGTPFVTFAVQPDSVRSIQVEVTQSKIGGLLDAGPVLYKNMSNARGYAGPVGPGVALP